MVHLTDEEFEALRLAVQVGRAQLIRDAHRFATSSNRWDQEQASADRKSEVLAGQAISKLADFNLG